MSGEVIKKLPLSSDRRVVEEQAAAFVIARRDREDWTREEEVELEAWLAQSLFHRAAYLRFNAAWSSADRVRALRSSSLKAPDISRIRNIVMRTAIGFLLLAGSGFAAKYFWPVPTSTYETRVGAHKVLHLADGSEVELNTDTVLRVAMSGNSRRIWLDRGEAYFRVAHDPTRAFVVDMGSRSVTALGTAFAVRRDTQDIQVSLFEGRVRFNAKDEAARMPIDLVPGDTVTATDSAVTLSRKSKHDLDTSVSWRRGVLVFNHTPLSEAARELNRYNTEKIVIGDAATARTTIGGTFEATNAAGFARVAHAVLGLRVEYLSGETVISQ